MNDVVIRAKDLKKVYRLYAKPSYRFMDMFGLLGDRPGAYTEHAALDGVNLEIHRGEKVAIIGRNGAGKSTFLKLVTGVIEPTSGVLNVSARVHALLQIGTGFHPDFTGRENVYAYLAQLGVTGTEAEKRCAEAIDFAELEDYIDQPVKTYSTGMAVRLMFSVSTAITPDLLVLDEVLGVGDAYFAQKSYDRLRELSSRDGTTLLLVTHDVYSASRLCERVLWIDRGVLLMDGSGGEVVKAYEDSIRKQEEQRLRIRKAQRLRELAEGHGEHQRFAVLEIRSRDGAPQSGVVYFSDVQLVVGDAVVSKWPFASDDDFAEVNGSHLQREGSNWGSVVEWNGRRCRALLNYGASFHKVAGVFALPPDLEPGWVDRLRCRLHYAAPDACDVTLHLRVGSNDIELTPLAGTTIDWATHEALRASGEVHHAINASGMHGSGAFAITDARFIDEDGEDAHILRHGCPATLEISYRIRDPRLRERTQIVVAVHRDGVQDVCRYITRALEFDAATHQQGTIVLTMPSLTLTDGTYAITIMIAKEGYYDGNPTLFYTINPDVYCCISRMFEVSVVGAGLIGSGTMHVMEGQWTIK